VAQDESRAPAGINTKVASPARVCDYWLGGKDNFPADRAAGDAMRETFPGIVTGVRMNRAFLGRAVTYLTAEAGIRQFLDIGTGLPTADNTHEVAQRAAPDSRVITSTITSAADRYNSHMGDNRATVRTRPEILRFLAGLDLVEPGLVQLHQWHPGPGAEDSAYQMPALAGVGVKPRAAFAALTRGNGNRDSN